MIDPNRKPPPIQSGSTDRRVWKIPGRTPTMMPAARHIASSSNPLNQVPTPTASAVVNVKKDSGLRIGIFNLFLLCSLHTLTQRRD